MTSASSNAASRPATAQTNLVQVENAKPGSTDWLLTRVVRHDDEIYELGWRRRRGIEAYASHTSIKAGERLDVHVSTYPVSRYSVNIYRMGYYGRRWTAVDANDRAAARNHRAGPEGKRGADKLEVTAEEITTLDSVIIDGPVRYSFVYLRD